MKTPINYIHNIPPSFESQIIQSFMSMTGMKNDIERKLKKKNFSQNAASLPKSLKSKFDTKLIEKNDYRVWIINPKQNVSKKVILYLHGGAYIFNITKYHWNFIKELLDKTSATIIVADYPLAPGANSTDVYKTIETIYKDFLADLPSRNMIFMGDSAGAGIALGFARKLRNQNKTQPAQIILLSPWLDVTMSNAEILDVDKKDKILGIKGLQMAGKAYAGQLDTKDFRVSPIYGNLSGLGRISVFIGTHDLLIADVKKLKQLLNEENIPMNYFEYPKMFHAWVIVTRLKESQHAIEQISMLINSSSA